MGKEDLIHDLQQRLSKALASEAELKKTVGKWAEQGERQEVEINKLHSQLAALQQSCTGLQLLRRAVQSELGALVQEFEILPSETEKLISRLENESIDIQTLGGALVWMETTARKTLEMLQETESMLQSSSLSDSAAAQEVEKCLAENQELKRQVQENEEHVVEMQHRESELGSSYNALLGEYENLCQYVAESEEEQEQPKLIEEAHQAGLRRNIDSSDINSVILNMDKLQSQLGEVLTEQSSSLDAAKSRGDRIRDRMDRISLGTETVGEIIQRGTDGLESQLTQAFHDQEQLTAAVQSLNSRVSSIPPTVAPRKQTAESGQLDDDPPLTCAPGQHEVTEEGWKEGEGQPAAEKGVEATLERLSSVNHRLFDFLRSQFDHSTDNQKDLAGRLNLEMRLTEKTREFRIPASMDDLCLHFRRPADQWQTEKQQSEIAENVSSMSKMKDQMHELEDTAEFQQFLISQQENLLQSNKHEIQELIRKQKTATELISDLAARLEEKNDELEVSYGETESLTQRKKQMEERVMVVCRDLTTLKNKASSLEIDIKTAAAKLHQLTEQTQEIQSELQPMESQIQLEIKRIHQQEINLNALSQDKEAAENQLTKLKRDLETKQADVQRMEGEKNKLKQAVQEKNDELKEVVLQGKMRMKEIQELETRQQELENTQIALKDQYATLQTTKTKRQESIQDLQSTTEKQEHQIQMMQRNSSCTEAQSSRRSCPQTAGTSETTREEVPALPYSADVAVATHDSPARIPNETSKEDLFSCTSLSGDLLIQCLEQELKKQQETVSHQTQTIQELKAELESTKQRNTDPIPLQVLPSPGNYSTACLDEADRR